MADPTAAEPQKYVVKDEDIPDYELARTRNLPRVWLWIVALGTLVSIALVMNQIFAWRFFVIIPSAQRGRPNAPTNTAASEIRGLCAIPGVE